MLFGLLFALSHGLPLAGRDGADAFWGVASLADEDARPPVGAVLVNYPGAALFADFGGGDVAEFAGLECSPCHGGGLPGCGGLVASIVAHVACFEGKKKAAPSQ